MSSLFKPKEYKNNRKVGVFGYMDIPDIEHMWVEFRNDGRLNIMYGTNKKHSKILDVIHTNDLGTGYHKSKHHIFTYKLSKKDGDLYIDAKIEFNKSARDPIYPKGLIMTNADYKYFLGLLNRRKSQGKSNEELL